MALRTNLFLTALRHLMRQTPVLVHFGGGTDLPLVAGSRRLRVTAGGS